VLSIRVEIDDELDRFIGEATIEAMKNCGAEACARAVDHRAFDTVTTPQVVAKFEEPRVPAIIDE
jgi:hypothetical protein